MATDPGSSTVRSIPSPTRRALIFNQYLQTAGGGERLCFEIAAALESAGYEIHFVIAEDIVFEVEPSARAFGIEPKTPWLLFNTKTQAAIFEFCKAGSYDVFVNNTFGSYLKNAARVGFYVTMFPQSISQNELQAIESYDIVHCISNFTELYTIRQWPGCKPKVLVPPISEVNFSQPEVAFSEKERLIICIGRFNVRGHSKCQLEAIKTFVQFQDEGVLDESWKLVVAGRVNEGEENLRYLGECVKEATKNVTILEGLPLPDLIDLYRRASALWQFTGIGRNFGFEPELCEHLGFVALDCFAYGTIPIVYQRGGLPYIIDHGLNGYCFGDENDLGEIMSIFSQNFGSHFHHFQFAHSKLTARRFSFDSFAKQLSVLLQEARPDDF